MEQIIVNPYVNAGPVIFGAHRDEVRKKVGQVIGRKVRNTETDSSDELNAFIYYNELLLCNAIEFNRGGNPVFRERQLFDYSLGNLLSWFNEIDGLIETTFGSIISMRYGIGFWHEVGLNDLNQKPHTVICFQKGYYD